MANVQGGIGGGGEGGSAVRYLLHWALEARYDTAL
jgi:hypothetical protein